ncbi:MAG: type I DNA topoisomerase [Deltaproteobacteria bacterium]|nr:type I DNA topoisomerase [Deltaproteobacteria bacterium]
MSKSLIIVESPTKAKTIGRILPEGYEVISSNGHVIDLPAKELAVDPEKGFALKNRVIPSKRKILSQISKAASDADRVLLASDPDREGEAIAVLIARHLKIPEDKVYRVLFHEITKKGILKAIENPGRPDELKFEAQQARRAIDRLVGYKVSPVLWKKIKRGISAGRVQSVALRLICEREKDIIAFSPENYWLIFSHLKADQPPEIKARLISVDNERIGGTKNRLSDESHALEVQARLRKELHSITDIQVKKVHRSPAPPFITSTLQQDAARKVRFTAKKTMMIAQQLYEGVALGNAGTTGLITYMRTDSLRVSKEAIDGARQEIARVFGPDHLPKTPRTYRNRKGAQDAHEAIRPTNPELDPKTAAQYLNKDQARLYELIYKRFIASQMADAILEKTLVSIQAGPFGLQVAGQVTIFNGFTALYEEGRDDEANGGPTLPPMKKGQKLTLVDVEVEKKTTQPPPRFTEATLVKILEEKGIGRPSTYAATLETIQKRSYVIKEQRRFLPTTLGMAVNDYLVSRFPRLVDVKFTADMEDQLDSIAEGNKTYTEMLSGFYNPFTQELLEAETAGDAYAWGMTDMQCPDCQKPLQIKMSGKTGEFLACSGYPECKFTSNFKKASDGSIELVQEQEVEERCPQCGSPMVLRQGRGGPFIGCTRYPECRGTLPLSTGVHCPEDGCDGELVVKRSRKGRTFYGCSSYPKCKYALWDEPVSHPCPECGNTVMTRKVTRGGEYLACPRKECKYRMQVDASG